MDNGEFQLVAEVYTFDWRMTEYIFEVSMYVIVILNIIIMLSIIIG